MSVSSAEEKKFIIMESYPDRLNFFSRNKERGFHVLLGCIRENRAVERSYFRIRNYTGVSQKARGENV